MSTDDPEPVPCSDREPMRQLHAWIDADLHRWVRAYAYDHELSKSRVIRRLLDEARRREPLPSQSPRAS